MDRRDWAKLSPEQREQLQRDGISQSDWEAGSSPIGDPPSDPPSDPPGNAGTSGEFPDPDELGEAVSNPDGNADFWRGLGGGRLGGRAHDELEDRALRNMEREVGESDKYNRNGLAERMEGMTPNQLRTLSAMNGDQIRQMATWAANIYRRTGSRSFIWLLYH